jgi:hypothetical protein
MTIHQPVVVIPVDGQQAMRDKTDPWAVPATATGYLDPFATPTATTAPAVDQFPPAPKREREAFQMGSGQFVGPETDPLTGGPNWDQGPLQRP